MFAVSQREGAVKELQVVAEGSVAVLLRFWMFLWRLHTGQILQRTAPMDFSSSHQWFLLLWMHKNQVGYFGNRGNIQNFSDKGFTYENTHYVSASCTCVCMCVASSCLYLEDQLFYWIDAGRLTFCHQCFHGIVWRSRVICKGILETRI